MLQNLSPLPQTNFAIAFLTSAFIAQKNTGNKLRMKMIVLQKSLFSITIAKAKLHRKMVGLMAIVFTLSILLSPNHNQFWCC